MLPPTPKDIRFRPLTYGVGFCAFLWSWLLPRLHWVGFVAPPSGGLCRVSIGWPWRVPIGWLAASVGRFAASPAGASSLSLGGGRFPSGMTLPIPLGRVLRQPLGVALCWAFAVGGALVVARFACLRPRWGWRATPLPSATRPDPCRCASCRVGFRFPDYLGVVRGAWCSSAVLFGRGSGAQTGLVLGWCLCTGDPDPVAAQEAGFRRSPHSRQGACSREVSAHRGATSGTGRHRRSPGSSGRSGQGGRTPTGRPPA